MFRKQGIVLLIGLLSLVADGFAALIQYLDQRYVYGNPPDGFWEILHFFAPFGLFAAGVIVITAVLLFVIRRK